MAGGQVRARWSICGILQEVLITLNGIIQVMEGLCLNCWFREGTPLPTGVATRERLRAELPSLEMELPSCDR